MLGYSFTLDQESASEIQRISAQTGVAPNQLIGVALRMLSITAEARVKNRRVLVTSNSGYPVEEIVIPA